MVMQTAKQSNEKHQTGGVDVQAASYDVPDAIATCAHPILTELHRRIPDETQYVEVAELVRHLCHPQTSARATADDALQARLFTAPAPSDCNSPVWCVIAVRLATLLPCCLHEF